MTQRSAQRPTTKLNPGDLIEVNRGVFKHWAVYIGRGEVVHLIKNDDDRGKILREDLKQVCGDDSCKVNNLMDGSHTPRPARDIVEEALQWVGKTVKYDLTEWNCEHFATKLRYGVGKSWQVVKGVGLAVVAGAAALVGVQEPLEQLLAVAVNASRASVSASSSKSSKSSKS